MTGKRWEEKETCPPLLLPCFDRPFSFRGERRREGKGDGKPEKGVGRTRKKGGVAQFPSSMPFQKKKREKVGGERGGGQVPETPFTMAGKKEKGRRAQTRKRGREEEKRKKGGGGLSSSISPFTPP